MLKISCRMSRFLTKWYFLAKFFPAPDSKNVSLYDSYRTRFIKQIFIIIIVNTNKRTSLTMPFGYSKQIRISRNPGRVSINR